LSANFLFLANTTQPWQQAVLKSQLSTFSLFCKRVMKSPLPLAISLLHNLLQQKILLLYMKCLQDVCMLKKPTVCGGMCGHLIMLIIAGSDGMGSHGLKRTLSLTLFPSPDGFDG